MPSFSMKKTFQHLQLNFGTWDHLGLPGPILRGADLVAKLNALETHQEMQSRLGGPDIGCNGRVYEGCIPMDRGGLHQGFVVFFDK